MSYIEYIDRGAIVETPEVAFTYAVSEQPRDFEKFRLNNDTLDWSNYENYLGDYIVYPYGSNNDIPEIIKEVIQNNYIAPGLLKRKTELLWGLGPRLYYEEFEGNRIVRKWVDDKDVWEWFEGFKEELKQTPNLKRIGISYAGETAQLKLFRDELQKLFPEVMITFFHTTPVISTHTGSGAFAIMYYSE